MENLPLYISLLFACTTFFAAWIFVKATGGSKTTLFIIVALFLVQAVVAKTGFYTHNQSIPPHFALAIGPSLLFIAAIFLTAKGRLWANKLNTEWLTWLHVVRVPVEITLLLLALHKQLPELMTFEGKNFDIVAGLTAPIVAWLGYKKHTLNSRLLLLWNVLALALLVNIISMALLTIETPFQQFAFDQPNRALGYFPFIWLACFVAPVVLLSHIVCIRQLLHLRNKPRQNTPTGTYLIIREKQGAKKVS